MPYRPLAKKHILNQSILSRMHDTAVDILSRTGIAVEHPEILGEL